MPRYRFSVPHASSREKIKEKVEYFSEKHGTSMEWKQEGEGYFSGQHKGFSFSGVFRIFEDRVDVSVNLPLLAMPFKSVIKAEVVKELEEK